MTLPSGKFILQNANDLFERLRKKAWEQGVPLTGLFELTPRCTLDCEMCYVHLERRQMQRPELSTEEWKNLMGQACDAGMIFATLTGGESLLYPGFRELYLFLTARGVLVSVFTNATLLHDELVLWLAEHCPQRVQISVYGSSPEVYRRVTGNAEAFAKVDRAIDMVREAGIPFDLAITVTRNLVEDFEALYRYCMGKNPRQCRVTHSPFDARPETGRQAVAYMPALEQQARVLQLQYAVGQEYLQRGQRYGEEECEVQEKKQNRPLAGRGLPCAAGRNSFSVTWRGEMLPCGNMFYSVTYPLKSGFAEAWKTLHGRCVSFQNPEECVACSLYPVCRYCAARHYAHSGEGKRDPRVCDETKYMRGKIFE